MRNLEIDHHLSKIMKDGGELWRGMRIGSNEEAATAGMEDAESIAACFAVSPEGQKTANGIGKGLYNSL
ncbi:hypothetical protein [Bacillus benzoevorans]|uniref:Uncharacterized protein n=1 Tax=Bacillus benzoevorans TaxID=1456 RepID=A0A7X0HR87_9BACI|nr:hypothetical protein [Bacillus benzoevorans]MBB6445463.1 hypothetical protein [Bacillus benzoevorans]